MSAINNSNTTIGQKNGGGILRTIQLHWWCFIEKKTAIGNDSSLVEISHLLTDFNATTGQKNDGKVLRTKHPCRWCIIENENTMENDSTLI